MSKLEEFYRALVKDPDLDIKAGQTREQAAKAEANYRARQYDNNTKALSLATEPEESSINSLFNHIQQMTKAYSEVALLKAKKDNEDDEDKKAKEKEAFENAYNYLTEEESKLHEEGVSIDVGPDEYEKVQAAHNKKVTDLGKVLDKLDRQRDQTNYSLKGLKYNNKNLLDQFSSEGTFSTDLDFKEIEDHFMIGAGKGYFEEQEPDKYNTDNPLTTQQLREMYDAGTGVQDIQTSSLTGTLGAQTKKVGGGERSGIFANKAMSDITKLKPKEKPEGKKVAFRGKPDIKSMRALADSYEKKYNRDIRAELGLDENGKEVDDWEDNFRYGETLYSFLEGDQKEGTGVFHHDKKSINVGEKNVDPQGTHKNVGMHWNASAFKEGKSGMTADGLRKFDDVLESVNKIVGNWDKHVESLPTESDVQIENSQSAQSGLEIPEYSKEYIDSLKQNTPDVHTGLTTQIKNHSALLDKVEETKKSIDTVENTRPKGSPVDWTDTERSEWGYELEQRPARKVQQGTIPPQEVPVPTGEGKLKELEDLQNELTKNIQQAKTNKNLITQTTSGAITKVPKYEEGWENNNNNISEEVSSEAPSTDSKAENRPIRNDVKKYMEDLGYSKPQINGMENAGLFHPNADRTQIPFGQSAIAGLHEETHFDKHLASKKIDKKITEAEPVADSKAKADAKTKADADSKAKAEAKTKADADAKTQAAASSQNNNTDVEQQAIREEVDGLMDTHKKIIEHMYEDRYGKNNGVISLDRFKEKLKDKWYKSGFDAAEEDIAGGFKSKTKFDETAAKQAQADEDKGIKTEEKNQEKEDKQKKADEDKAQKERDRKQKEENRLRQREAKEQDTQDNKDANSLPHSFDGVDLSDRFSWDKQQKDLGIDKISKDDATHLARQLMSHKEFHQDRMNGKTSEQLDHAIFLLGKKGADLKGLKKEQKEMGDGFGTREHLQSTKDDLTHSQNHKATTESNDEHSKTQRADATAEKEASVPKTDEEKSANIKQLQEDGKYPDMDLARQKISDGWEYSFETQQWHMTDWKKQQTAKLEGSNAATLSHGTHQHNGQDAHQNWDASSKSFKPSNDSFTIDGKGKMHAVTDGSSPKGGPANARKVSGDALNHTLSNSGYKVSGGKLGTTQRDVPNFVPHAQHIGDTSVKPTGLDRAAQNVGQAATRGYKIGYDIGRNPASAVSSFLSGVKSRISGTEKGYPVNYSNPLNSLLENNPETISKHRQELLKRLSK